MTWEVWAIVLATPPLVALLAIGADRLFNHVNVPPPGDPTAPDPTAPGNSKAR